tara:strand:- start:301 stop:741 length:441 start_codon:yes stop_codon:yes gene_type:complete
MTIEDIINSWREDCKLDDTELDSEALRIPNLHAKYLRMLAENRVKLKALKVKQKQLHQTLYDYYKGDLNNPQDLEKLKREPWPKTVLKQDMPMYIDADDDMIKMLSRIAMQEEVVGVCEEILKSVNNRGFQIKNAIDWRRLTNFGT